MTVRAPEATESPRRPGERGAAALDGVGAQGAADHADEAGRDDRVEDDRAGARGGLSGAEQRDGALRGLAADLLGAKGLRRAPHAEAETGLLVALGVGDRLEVGVGGGRLEGSGETGRGGDRDPFLLVGVDGRLDRASRAGRPRGRPARSPWRARSCAPSSTWRASGRRAPGCPAGPRRRPPTAARRTRRGRRSAPTRPRPGRSPRRPRRSARSRRHSRIGDRSSSERRAPALPPRSGSRPRPRRCGSRAPASPGRRPRPRRRRPRAPPRRPAWRSSRGPSQAI